MLYLGIQFVRVIARTIFFIRSNASWNYAQLIRNYKEFYIETVIYLYLFTNRGLHTIRLSGQFFSCLDSFAVAVAKISPWLSRAERASLTCETDITGTVFRKARAARKFRVIRAFSSPVTVASFDSYTTYVSELVYPFVSCAQPSTFVRKHLADNARIKQLQTHDIFLN